MNQGFVRRHGRWVGIFGALTLAGLIPITVVHLFSAQIEESGYVGSETCVQCHRKIWDTYQRTGMARSFYRPSVANTIEDFIKNNTFHHEASDSYFTMIRRGGKFYQRRYQLDPNGNQVNLMEKQIDYIMGSGNHSRAYLSRTARNTLIELPLAWYAEKSGYWAMNPGVRPAES